MKIHKEGINILIFLFIILLVINLIVFRFWPEQVILKYVLAIGSVILFVFVLQFFRDPKIITPFDDQFILAPADGKVVVVEKTTEKEYLKEERIQISIFMSPVDVHINRSPATGKIKYYKYHPGKYLVAWHPKSSTENERTTMVLELSNGIELVVRQIAGIMARRIKFYMKEGDYLKQGQEFGFIRFGSRLDVFVPTDAAIQVTPGDTTKAGVTILARV